MVKTYHLEDGTWLVPYLIHDMEDEYSRDAELERSILEQARNDGAYRDGGGHPPFIDDVLIGNRIYRALVVPGTEEESRSARNEIERRQKRRSYHDRCRVSDGKGGLRQCPKKAPNPDYGKVDGAPRTVPVRCDLCPYNRAWKDEGRVRSYEGMTTGENGERIDRPEFGTEGLVGESDMWERVGRVLLDVTAEKDSRVYKVVRRLLMMDGAASINQACEDLGLGRSGIYKALHSKRIRDAVLDAIADDPLIEIEKLL